MDASSAAGRRHCREERHCHCHRRRAGVAPLRLGFRPCAARRSARKIDSRDKKNCSSLKKSFLLVPVCELRDLVSVWRREGRRSEEGGRRERESETKEEREEEKKQKILRLCPCGRQNSHSI
jgi:hypothetical protein